MRFVLVTFLLWGAAPGPAQTSRDPLLKQAQAAYAREMARDKAGDCPNAGTTLAINTCLADEVKTSTANYKSYSDALRAMLAQLKDPTPEEDGPTGKPLTTREKLANFDQSEAAWARYRDAMCTASVGLYRGGSIVGAISGTCQLMMLRSHLRELNNVYGDYFSR
jgi:uncharacterized protein YecT (DUF1311 family)